MYGISITVYLVGQTTNYRGDLQLPATGLVRGLSSALRRVAEEVQLFVLGHAEPGTYEAGVYIEQTRVQDHEAEAQFWKLMGNLNKVMAMTWHQEVREQDLIEGEGSHE